MARQLFRQMLTERRAFAPGSADWAWRTQAARTYARICLGVPTSEWNK